MRSTKMCCRGSSRVLPHMIALWLRRDFSTGYAGRASTLVLELLQHLETTPKWLAQGVLQLGAQLLPQGRRQVLDQHIKNSHRLIESTL